MGISNEQKYGKMLGGSKAKSRKNNNNNVYRQPTFADIMGIQEGTGGVHSPIAPDPYTGFGSTTQYEEPVHSDFGMTPQAPRSEYFGPSWGPGAGNASESEYFKKVQAVADSGPILNSKKIKSATKKYSGPRAEWTPGVGNDYHSPANIVQAVRGYDGHPSAGVTYSKPVVNWDGAPSAGVTYPEPPSSYDPRIDGMIKEVKGRDESVFTTIDDLIEKGGYTQDEIMAGTDKSDPFWMSQNEAAPRNDIDLNLTDEQIDNILNPRVVAPGQDSSFDVLPDNRGTFTESPFVGPGDYANWAEGRDSREGLSPTNWNPGVGNKYHIPAPVRMPMNLSGYVKTPPQSEVYESPRGVVDPRHMDAYNQMIGQTAPEGVAIPPHISANQIDTTGVGEETVDLSRNVVRQPWSHPSAGVSYPDPVGDRIADLSLQIEQMKSVGQGGSQYTLDLERQRDVLANDRNNTPNGQSIGLAATLDSIFK